jgi:WD40 repeat protein
MILWDIDPLTGRWSQREVLSGHAADVREAVVDPSGRRLITVGLDHTIISWDMGPDAGFGRSYPALDGRWISNRPVPVPGGLVVVPTRPGRSTSEVRGEPPGPDTLNVAAAFLDPDTGEVVDLVPVGDTIKGVSFGSSVAVSPDGSMVAVTWGLGATVLDTRTHDLIQEIVLPPNGDPGTGDGPFPATVVWSAGWTPDGSTLLLGAEGNVEQATGGYLVPVDTSTWDVRARIEIGGAAQTMEVSPDERLIVVTTTASSDLVILDATTLEVRRTVSLGTDDRIGDLSFSDDGRLLAGGGGDGLVHVFDTVTWEYGTPPVAVQDDRVLQVEWLPGSRTVVTSGANGKVSLFDVERGQLRARPLRASGEPVEGYAHLVPGEKDELIVLSGERTGWRYPLKPAAWLEEACGVVGRNLSSEEWDRYLPERDFAPTCSDLP